MAKNSFADKPQSEKFIEKARELGADENEGAFDEKLRKIASAPKHKSDCAVYNAPAEKPGRCTCGATDGR